MEPLVWLPFDPADLGDVPSGLRYEHVDLDIDPETLPDSLPASRDDVRFVVPPYRFDPRDGLVLEQLPALEVVQTLTAGVEHLRPHVPSGVTLCNGRGIHDASTAELTLSLILASLHGLPGVVRAQDEGRWAPFWRDALADSSVLIVGAGQIGAAIEERLWVFEVSEVVRVARRARPGVHAVEELPELLPSADVVVIVVPGTAATTGLFDAALLGRMKDGALLVNVSRGSVVDTDALLAELHRGRLRAAVDVTDPEPPPADHPWWSAPHLLMTPHVGGASTAMWPRAHRLVRSQLERYAAGRALANVMTGDY